MLKIICKECRKTFRVRVARKNCRKCAPGYNRPNRAIHGQWKRGAKVVAVTTAVKSRKR